MTNEFPKPWCPTCGEQPTCGDAGRTRADYPRCRRPLLRRDPERVASLLRWQRRFHRVNDPGIDRVSELVVGMYREDGLHYSEIFEPSFSRDRRGYHMLRFSYAFPGFRTRPEPIKNALRALCEPFGENVVELCERFCRALSDPCTQQPLFGLAHDDPSRSRVKLYLQFTERRGRAPLSLAARLLDCGDLESRFGKADLHLLGLDLGRTGLQAAKLYFMYPSLSVTDLRSRIGRVDLIDHLERSGTTELKRVLAIHRMRGPRPEEIERPREIDFSLAENDLLPERLRGCRTTDCLSLSDGPFAALNAGFPIALRRVSAPVGKTDKFNVYYVLTE